MEKVKSSKTMIGRVVSDKPSKTVVVAVESRREHPIYKKSYKVVKKYQVHDENGAAHYGDIVEMIPTRPLSRTKNFRLLRVVTKGEVAESAELKEIT
ncbi:30S ribosomal protein S17 [Dehalogenimonas alkenigignens]|uniref:Small ribosomal subunit protein uS17 n=1 Tax=Dehalogenimonas alkenigignens TaxID=1217799 RepID=A0A0W0GFZ4_9CHLR|nr:30S ribosomal protein S17 [Dehalogenimonas alkenigignens]KTB47476.1 30S ribosomal protein S17 [Dehalogenimonas alkenigignens]PVV83465.1 30S ribosomal protein S17 [Dehalogenimonas alkenigignens]